MTSDECMQAFVNHRACCQRFHDISDFFIMQRFLAILLEIGIAIWVQKLQSREVALRSQLLRRGS